MKQTFKPSLLALALVCGTYYQLSAQTNVDSITSQELIPVEVKSIRVSSKSPFAVSNLDMLQIQKLNNGQDIPYILDRTPSVIVSSDAGTGIGYTDMRIRGADNARINFTLNGIPLNDAESQGAFFVDFPDVLSSTNSIQVQRGVGASTNGAGTFGASVNMSNIEQNDTAQLRLYNSYGSFNTWHNMLHVASGALSSGFKIDARLSRITSNGYIDRSASNLKSLQLLTSWQSKDKMTSVKLNLLTGHEKTGEAWNGVPEDSVNTNRTYNELGLKPDGTFYNNQTDNYRQDYYQLFFNHYFQNYWSANLALFLTRGIGYYNEYKMDRDFADYGLNNFVTPRGDTFTTTNLIRQKWLDNYFYGTVYSLQYHKNNTEFIFGGAATQYDGKHYGIVTWADYGVPDNYRWYNDNAYKSDLNFYAKWMQSFANYFNFFIDIQYRNVAYTINGFKENPNINFDKRYNFLNPKVGLSYLRYNSKGGLHKAYASLAIANKEPNRDDYEASPISLPKPEHLYDFELGYHYTQPNFDIGANIYYMDFKDQLVLTGAINDVGAYTRTNVPKSYRTGIELEASIHPLHWLLFWSNATFSKNKIGQLTEYIDDYDNGGQLEIEHKNTDIALSPNSIIALGTNISFFESSKHHKQLTLDIFGKYIGSQFLDNTSNNSKQIDAYTIVNVKLNYSFDNSIFGKVNIAFAINNIFNTMYESKGYTYSYLSGGKVYNSNYYFPQAGTNCMFSVGFLIK